MPFIVFVDEELSKQAIQEVLKNRNIPIDIRKLIKIKNDVEDLRQTLYKLLSYYNQLGDEFIFNGRKITLPYKVFLAYLNLLVIGAPGAGKSTFINKLLGKQRSLVKKGEETVTTKITKYHHQKYPLLVYDTPGIDKKKDRDILVELIKEHHQEMKKLNNDNIHFVLYVINGESRSFVNDIPFLEKLLKINIPIVFLINYCDTNEKATDKVKSLDSVLQQHKINNYEITAVNLVEPLRGYKELFCLLYDMFKKHIIKSDVIKTKLEQGRIQEVITNHLKNAFFFNNIENYLNLKNRMVNQINTEISSFIDEKYSCYKWSLISKPFSLGSHN